MTLTPLQAETLKKIEQGMSKAQIAKEEGVSRAAISLRLKSVKLNTLTNDLNTRKHTVPETTGSPSGLNLDAHNIGFITQVHGKQNILFGRKTGKYPPQYISECNGFRIILNTDKHGCATTLEAKPLEETRKRVLRTCEGNLKEFDKIIYEEVQRTGQTLNARHKGLELSYFERNRDAHYCITNDRLAHALTKKYGSQNTGKLRRDRTPDKEGTWESEDEKVIQDFMDLPEVLNEIQAQLGGLKTLSDNIGELQHAVMVMSNAVVLLNKRIEIAEQRPRHTYLTHILTGVLRKIFRRTE